MTAPGKQNDTPAVSDSVESTRQEELLREALLALRRLLQHAGIADQHAEDIDFEDHHAESVARSVASQIDSFLNIRAPSVGGAQQASGEKEAATAATCGVVSPALLLWRIHDALGVAFSSSCRCGGKFNDDYNKHAENCSAGYFGPLREQLGRILSEHVTKSDGGSGFPQTLSAPSDRNARQATETEWWRYDRTSLTSWTKFTIYRDEVALGEVNTEEDAKRITESANSLLRLLDAPAPSSDSGSGSTKQEEWGCVYNDIEGHWQIISHGGLVIIDDIGEFRYPDCATEEAAHKALAAAIRDNHNASVFRLAYNLSLPVSVLGQEKEDLGTKP